MTPPIELMAPLRCLLFVCLMPRADADSAITLCRRFLLLIIFSFHS